MNPGRASRGEGRRGAGVAAPQASGPDHPARVPLSASLLAAAGLLRGVLAGRSLSASLPAVAQPLRASAQALVFHALRRLGMAQALRELLVPRRPPADLDALLLLALALAEAQLRPAPDAADAAPDAADAAPVPRYAMPTLVDQAVRAAGTMPAGAAGRGLINGVLRRCAREFDTLSEQALRQPGARYNLPGWWLRTLRRDYPGQWQAVVEAGDGAGPMTLRVNHRRASTAQVLAALADAGVEAAEIQPQAIRLAQPRPVQQLPGFAQGWWSVQDLSAQQAGRLLPLADGVRVLDACAAPGGKTAHILERAQVELLALDSEASRLSRVDENLRRLGLLGPGVRLCCADAADPDAWWDGRPFDAILADVPCTGSGVLRRHPDMRWLRRASDVGATVALQRRIVQALWPLLKPGGHLLYATCSVFREENEGQMEWLLGQLPQACRLPAPGQLLPGAADGAAPGGDGFFYALIAKQAGVVNNAA